MPLTDEIATNENPGASTEHQQTIGDAGSVAEVRSDAAITFAVVVLLATGFLTTSVVPGWAPRMGALLLALPLGVVCLARLLKRRDIPAVILCSAIAWSAFVAIFQTAPGIRLLGMLGLEASVFIYLGAAACWALGRCLGDAGRRLLPWVLIGALALNGLFGVLQVVMQVDQGEMILYEGRAHGLATYSIYFGSLMACGAMVLATLEVDRKWFWYRLGGVFAFAVASGMSGSRAAFGAAMAVGLYLACRQRDVTGALIAPFVLAGTFVASWISSFFANRNVEVLAPTAPADAGATVARQAGTSLDRLSSGDGFAGGGLSWRIDAWRAGFDAWIERPITGWGVGNFRQAVQATVGKGFEQSAPRFDAHNIIIELLTTIGLPGFLLFSAFGILVARKARGPLAYGAFALALSWLLQPAGLSTLPLALLLCGAATAPLTKPADLAPERTTRAPELTAALGLVLLLAFLAVDLRLSRAVDSADPQQLESVAVLYPFDPTVDDLVAQAWMFEAATLRTDPASSEESRDLVRAKVFEWSTSAIKHQPDAPRWRDSLAVRQIQYGQFDAARLTLEQALELQPSRPDTLSLLNQLDQIIEADQQGQAAEVANNG